jgi:hypothetical protein
MDDLQRLNPQPRMFSIGTRKKYPVSIYPLSFGDQLKVSDAMTEVIQQFAAASGGGMTNAAVVSFAIKTITERIEDIFKFCTDPEEVKTILADAGVSGISFLMTNEQVVDFAEVVFMDNFDRAIKKGKDLFERIKSQFQSERSSPGSLEGIPNTGSMTFSEKVS